MVKIITMADDKETAIGMLALLGYTVQDIDSETHIIDSELKIVMKLSEWGGFYNGRMIKNDITSLIQLSDSLQETDKNKGKKYRIVFGICFCLVNPVPESHAHPVSYPIGTVLEYVRCDDSEQRIYMKDQWGIEFWITKLNYDMACEEVPSDG